MDDGREEAADLHLQRLAHVRLAECVKHLHQLNDVHERARLEGAAMEGVRRDEYTLALVIGQC